MFTILGADQKPYGPASAEQIRLWILEGRLNGQSLAQAEGSTGWRPLLDFPEFSPALGRPAPFALEAVPEKTNSMASASLVMGILSIVCCGCGSVFSILGIVFSCVAFSQLRRHPGQSGKGLAIAGLALSVAGLASSALMAAFGVFRELFEKLSR